MNVHAAGRVPPHHLVRHPRGAAPTSASTSGAAATTTLGTTSGDAVAAGAADAPAGTAADEAAGPATPGGNDTPFTHALHRGQGRKLGILRRMPSVEDVAAEQAAAGLGATDVVAGADGVEDTTPADGTVPTPSDDVQTGTDEPVVTDDGAVGARPTGEDDQGVEDDPTGTVVLDGRTMLDDLLGDGSSVETVVADGIDLIEQLQQRLEAARADELGHLPVEGPDATEV